MSFSTSNELKCLCKSDSVVYESTVAKASATLSRNSYIVNLSEPPVDDDSGIAIIGTLELLWYLSLFLYTSTLAPRYCSKFPAEPSVSQ